MSSINVVTPDPPGALLPGQVRRQGVGGGGAENGGSASWAFMRPMLRCLTRLRHPRTKTSREIREGEKLNEAAFKELIRSAVAANSAARARRASPKK